MYVVIKCVRFSELLMGLYTIPAQEGCESLPFLARANFLMLYILDQPTASSSSDTCCVFTRSGDEFIEVVFERRI